MKILICDIQVLLQGHNLGYIQNLIWYIENNPDEHEYTFLLNPEASSIPSIKSTAKNIKFIFFTEEEFNVFYEKGIIASTFQIWRRIEYYAGVYQADRLIIMALDIFQHAIGLAKTKATISGILFQPYTRLIPENNTFKVVLFHRLRQLRKCLTLRFMMRQNQLDKVFILNDNITVDKLNTRFSVNSFTYLPDPVYDYPNDDAVLNIRQKHNISIDRTILLCFGMIDAKKNVALIVSAAKHLSEKDAKKLCILVVGKVKAEYEITLSESINIAKKDNPQLQVAQVKGFVKDAEMESYVKQSDWVSLAYVNFYSSSGVVGLAARHNKPILATKFGVIGQQTQEYGLGLSVDAREVDEITNALELIVNQVNNYPKSAGRFVREHSPENFIKCLLQTED